MVAITVILAAVIGAFVLEIGDQQETAPKTSFDSDQRTLLLQVFPNDDRKVNTSQVTVSHAGGDVLSIDQTRLSVNGNQSVWGLKAHAKDGQLNKQIPQPNVFKTWGTNQRTEFKSGQSWNGIFYCGPDCKSQDPYPGFRLFDHPNIPVPLEDHIWFDPDNNMEDSGKLSYDGSGVAKNAECPSRQNPGTMRNCEWYLLGHADYVASDDTFSVVWTASSGGKTQTIFKTTVQ
jgi:hypothetical protein